MVETKWRYRKPLYVALLATLPAWFPAAAAQAAEPVDCPAACEVARAQVAGLVREFAADADRYTSTAFGEAETRTQFIDRFFEALGWDVTNRAQAHLYDQDVIPETRLRIGPVMRYADYGFRLDARAVFYVEAKAANQNIDMPKHVFQAKRYAWSSTRAELAVLTDFETLRVFDARILPSIQQPKAGELEQFHMNYTEYVENFPELWRTFAKSRVAQDSVREFLGGVDSSLERIEVDRAFLADLDRFRSDLGRDLYTANPRLTAEKLNEATHHILNQIVFSRVLEDRDIEPTGRLREAIEVWRARGAKGRLFDYLKAEFGRLERRYNSIMFGAHFSDGLKVPDRTLAAIVDALYPPTSPYAFDVIPVEVLGRAYEGYLGKRLEIVDGAVTLAPKPEVRKAGGVFYTPHWIVEYILDKTLAPRLASQKPGKLAEIRVLDPACGAGAFTVQMAARILAAATAYYAANPDKITRNDTEFPDAYRDVDGTYRLSAPRKAALIENTVFCVDVDPQAVEITKMWLYILMLEDEGSPIVTQERSYKIPNRIWPARTYRFKLPDLAGNVVNGNALVANDFSDDPAERKRVRAFDWQSDDSKISKSVRAGGFDVIAGNPPYISLPDAKKFIPEQHAYIRDTYASMGKGRPDLSYAFMEKALSLLKNGGSLGFIMANSFIWNESGTGLRRLIADCGCLQELVDFGVTKIFEDAGPATAIAILHKSKHRFFRQARLLTAGNPAMTKTAIQAMPDVAFQDFPMSKLEQERWAFPLPQDKAIFEAMERQPLRLGEIADTFVGINTGSDATFVVEEARRKGKRSLIRSKATGQEHWVETARLLPIVRSRDINRYQPPQNVVWLVSTYDEAGKPLTQSELLANWPLTYQYLLAAEPLLADQNLHALENQPWYTMSGPQKYANMAEPKLLVGWTPGKPGFAIDAEGRTFLKGSGGALGVISTNSDYSLEALLGILNSETAAAYMQATSAELWNGPQYRPGTLSRLPIPPLTADTAPAYAAIAEKVRRVLALGANPYRDSRIQEKLELEIDILVRQLYGVD